MYLNHPIKTSSLRLHGQRGFLIPLALFIVVVLGFLALAMSRMSVQTHLASAQELVSLQALYAAESGAQAGMQELFYDNNFSARSFDGVNGACQAMGVSLNYNNVSGLNNCRVNVICDCATCADPAAVTGFYTLESRGECGSGTTAATRTIRIGTYMGRQ